MATPEQILKQGDIYFKQDNIGGIVCSIGYVKKFKWSWFATQLNTFIVIGETTSLIDKSAIEDFSTACFQYALKNHQGWPRGLQSGVASIAILKGDHVNADAVQFCEKPTKNTGQHLRYR